MPIDNRTTGRDYPLPHPSNLLAEDVQRLRDALNAIDADVLARYTKTEVDQLITGLIGGAPGALDTLNELAAALGDDANFAATVTNALSNRYTKTESDARYVQGVTQTENVFTGNGSQTSFTLSQTPPTRESLLVTVDGVVQPVSEYSLSGSALILSEAPASGAKIRVLMLGVAGPVQSASTFSFAQAGAGAVTRTVDSKLKDVVSVKDFGAVGDGVTDDTAAIQAAVNAATISCGYVYLPAGTYKISSTIEVQATAASSNHYCSFAGDGPSKSVISVAMSSGAAISYTQSATNRFHLYPIVSGIAFIQSGTAGTSIGVRINATYGGLVENCLFSGLGSDAVSLYSRVGDPDLVTLVEVTRCRMLSCGGWAVNIDLGEGNGASAGHRFISNFVSQCNGAFKLCAYGGLVYGNTIANLAAGTTNPDIFLDYNGVTPVQWDISQNWMEKGRVGAILAEGANDCRFINNSIIYNDASSGLYGIKFAAGGNKRRCLISGTRFVIHSTLAFKCYEDDGAATANCIIQDTLFQQFGGSNVKYSLTGTKWLVRENGTPVSGLNADYEEGTWTVTLFDAASGGNASPTTVTGFYTKNGRLVTVSFRNLNDIVTTGMTGGNLLYISLPFTCITASVGFEGVVAFNSLTYPSGAISLTPNVANGSSRAIIRHSGNNTSSGFLTVSNITSGTTDIASLTLSYFTS